jgi:hypothetical protein
VRDKTLHSVFFRFVKFHGGKFDVAELLFGNGDWVFLLSSRRNEMHPY